MKYKLIIIFVLLSFMFGCAGKTSFNKVDDSKDMIVEEEQSCDINQISEICDSSNLYINESSNKMFSSSLQFDLADNSITFEVTVEVLACDTEDLENVIISVYDSRNLKEPLNVIHDQSELHNELSIIVDDVNFDGYKDFYYRRGFIAQLSYYRFWIWNNKSGVFEYSDSLSNLLNPEIHEDTRVVTSYYPNTVAACETKYYRYIDNRLSCIRSHFLKYPEENKNGDMIQELIVTDYIEGKETIVFYEIELLSNIKTSEKYKEFMLWSDINYVGSDVKE